MKKISCFLTIITMMAAMVPFQSCSSDKNEGKVITYANALVTVKPNADNTSTFLQLDDKTLLYPVNMQKSPFGTKEVRALTNFQFAEKQDRTDSRSVYVNWIDSILTKKMVTNYSAEENLKKYGSDGIEIVNNWVTIAEDGYLTLRFRTLWGGAAVHYLNLVYRTDANNPYTVFLYHNANGDVKGVLGDALVAFNLEGLPDTEGKTVDLTLQWISLSGETKSTTFKYCTRKTTSLMTADALNRVDTQKME